VLRRLQRLNMGADDLLGFLVRCAAINYAILLVWFGVFVFAHERLYRLHSRWFGISREAFDALNYGGVAVYKIGNMLLFLVPAIAVYWLRPG
jgi:hypothetical protein